MTRTKRTFLVFPCWALALLAGLPGLGACEDSERGGEGEGERPAECAGELSNARCIKACGIAAETNLSVGISYLKVGDTSSQWLQQPTGSYQFNSFLISGNRVSLDLPRELLTELDEGNAELPVCVPLSLPGGGEGLGQYMPSGNTFSTDQDYRGTVAITEYARDTRVIEGIFEFRGAAKGAGEDGADWVMSIEQGWFRVLPR